MHWYMRGKDRDMSSHILSRTVSHNTKRLLCQISWDQLYQEGEKLNKQITLAQERNPLIAAARNQLDTDPRLQ